MLHFNELGSYVDYILILYDWIAFLCMSLRKTQKKNLMG